MIEGSGESIDVLEIIRPSDLGDIAALGLTLSEGKRLLALVQQEIVAAQGRNHATRRPICRSVGRRARSRITARTRSPPCSARSRSGCRASAAPVAVGRRRARMASALPIDS